MSLRRTRTRLTILAVLVLAAGLIYWNRRESLDALVAKVGPDLAFSKPTASGIPASLATSASAPTHEPQVPTPTAGSKSSAKVKPFDKIPEVVLPDGVKVVALIFFGRRELVRVLECYLRRNLKKNGGLLDEVIWIVHTGNSDDLDYLDHEVLPSEAAYRKSETKGDYTGWSGPWEAVADPNAVYVKIDDDVVFIEDQTIPAIVKRVVENPQYFGVSANIVNNPALSWVHYHLGVFYPYWPEMTRPEVPPRPGSWRASELPSYEGNPLGPPGFSVDGHSPAPFEGHRWLPVREGTHDMGAFPVDKVTYDAFGPSLENWGAAAQLHYSFLQHLEQGDTWRYKFDLWDYQYTRLSINFWAFRGKDIMDVFPFPMFDDEKYLTLVRPKELQRHVVVDGTGLAVHFAFSPQYREGHWLWLQNIRWALQWIFGARYDRDNYHRMRWTDLLSRYDAYAREMVCGTTQLQSGGNVTTGHH